MASVAFRFLNRAEVQSLLPSTETLLEVIERTLEVKGTLAFCSLTPSIAKTFQIMGLAQYTRIFPDRVTALAELSPRQ